MPFIIHWVEACQGEAGRFSLSTPVGEFVVLHQGDVITATDWNPDSAISTPPSSIPPLARQLQAYWLSGDTVIHLNLLQQGSLFRNRVWSELCNIPFGVTISYSALAQKIGSAARAVGNACRDNPYPLIVPCHRVVAATGLGGYCGKTSGNFMELKTQLLAYEARTMQATLSK